MDEVKGILNKLGMGAGFFAALGGLTVTAILALVIAMAVYVFPEGPKQIVRVGGRDNFASNHGKMGAHHMAARRNPRMRMHHNMKGHRHRENYNRRQHMNRPMGGAYRARPRRR